MLAPSFRTACSTLACSVSLPQPLLAASTSRQLSLGPSVATLRPRASSSVPCCAHFGGLLPRMKVWWLLPRRKVLSQLYFPRGSC